MPNPELNHVCIPMVLGSPSSDDAVIAGAYFYAHRDFVVTNVVLVNGAALAASDTDYAIVKLKNGSTALATVSTKLTGGNGGLTADVGLAGTVSSGSVDAGSTLTVEYDETDTGTNVALTSAILLVMGYYKQTA